MFKFFRKYNKYIIPFGVSFLMVLFLVPSAFQQCSKDRSAIEKGMAGDREITQGDLDVAGHEIAVLRSLPRMSGWLGQVLGMIGGRDRDNTSLNWALLVCEAEDLGLYCSAAKADSLLRAFISDMSEQELGAMLKANRTSYGLLVQAIRHMHMIQSLDSLLQGQSLSDYSVVDADGITVGIQSQSIARVSDTRVAQMAKDMRTTVSARVATIGVDSYVDNEEELNEEELGVLFNNGRTKLTGSAGNYGFGYVRPRQVKLEYIAIALTVVRGLVEIDEIEANAYYHAHAELFVSEETEDGVAPKQLTYKEAREKVFKHLTEIEAVKKRDHIVKWCIATLAERSRQLPKQGDSEYREIVKDYVPLGLDELALEVQKEFGLLPKVVLRDKEWLTAADISGITGFGQSYLLIGSGETQQAVRVTQYIGSAKELEPSPDSILLAYHLQRGIASYPVIDNGGNSYIFRLTDARTSYEPGSLDEVRDQVERDMRRLNAYRRLEKKTGDEYLGLTTRVGLDKVAEVLGENVTVKPVLSVSQDGVSESFTRRVPAATGQGLVPPLLTVVGRSEKFVDGVFKLADKVNEAGGLDEAGEESRFGMISLDSRLLVLLVELTDCQTMEDELNDGDFRTNVVGLMTWMDAQSNKLGHLTSDSIADRVGFSSYQEGEEEVPEFDGDDKDNSVGDDESSS